MRPQTSARAVPVRLTLLVLLSVLITGLVSSLVFSPHSVAAAPATTNSDVNLRAGPGEWYDVLAVVPAGGAVSVDGDAVDGFSPITYNGMSGWVGVSFLIADGSGATTPYDTATYQTEPSVTTTGEATVVFDTDAGDTAQQGNRRDRDGGNNPPAATPPATNPGITDSSEQGIIDIIHQAAATHGQSPDEMVRVARCESSLNPRAVDPSGSYHGLFQFVPSTFAGTPYGDQDIYDPWANAHAAAWMWSEGRKSEWVCQ